MPIPPLVRRLRIAREKSGLSTDEVASRMGLKPAAVRHHHNGTRDISAEQLKQYSTLYAVSADWLLRGIGKGPEDPGDDSGEVLRLFEFIKKEQRSQAIDVLRALAGKKDKS